MKMHRSRQMSKPQKIQLPPPIISQSNPEASATTDLLQISSQELDLNAFDHIQIYERQHPQLKQPHFERSKSREPNEVKKQRQPVTTHYTQSHQRERSKSCFKPSFSEDISKLSQRNIVNPRNYLLLSSQNYKNIKIFDENILSKPQNASDRVNYKLKQSKNIASFIRKKNKSLMKQYMDYQQSIQSVNSTTIKRAKPCAPISGRMNRSCELSRRESVNHTSPMRIQAPLQIDQEDFIELKCTNPTFRNKRISYHHLRQANPATLTSRQK